MLDAEQRLLLDVMLAERADGYWAAFETAVVMARQNGKTWGLQAIALYKLFLLQDRLTVWTAHEYPTAAEAFRDIEALIDGAPHLSRKVKHISKTNGEEGFELTSGGRLNFRARSKRAGRGLSGNTVILDEAFALTASHMGSLLPTLRAVPNSQVVYASSAGHLQSQTLRSIRDRGRAGGSPSLAYVEWCAERRPCDSSSCDHRFGVAGCVLDDRDGWYAANPSLGRRVAVTAMQAERETLPPSEFARECLGWWEDPVADGAGALDMKRWQELADAVADRGTRVMFGLDVTEDRTASLVVGWHRGDGSSQVQITAPEDAAFPAYQAVERCAQLVSRWGGKVVPPRAFEDDLRRAGVPVLSMKTTDFPAACGAFNDAITAGTVRHGNQQALNESVGALRWRTTATSGERAWQLKDAVGIGPAVAATRLLWGLRARKAPPPPQVLKTSEGAPGDALTRMGF